jgi:predicted MPP superfamily phosphohydrolase
VGTRIIHLSDIHATGKWYSAYDVLLDAIADSRPDLICITGDFVDDRFNHIPALPTIHRLAAGLSAPLGVFGILGNHDREHFEPRLIGTNITLLNGQRRIVERNGSPIELIGLPGAERIHLTPRWLADIRRHPHTPGIPRIVLSHYPDHLRLIHRLTPDILLAGHTHGGQICLPGGFPLLKHDKLPRRFARGIHHLQNTWLIANRGFGFTGINLRLFCPSEVVEIELVG